MPQPSPPPLRHTRAHTHRHGGISRPRAPPRGLGLVNSPVGLVTGHPGTAAQSGPAGKAARTVGRRPGEALTQPNPTQPPQPASGARRRRGKQRTQARPARGSSSHRVEGGGGTVRPPSRRLAPQGQNSQAAPPGPSGGGVRGPGGPCLSAPPPGPRADGGRLERQRPRIPRGAAAPRGEGTAAATSAAPHQAPPLYDPHYPALPATDRQRNGGSQEGANGAARTEAGPGKAGARTRARRSLPPVPPPPSATLTHWRPTGPRPTPSASGNPHSMSIPQGGALETKDDRGGGHGPPNGARGRGAVERPPLPPPPAPPAACEPQERQPSAPPEPRGRPPSPRRDRNAREGTQPDLHAARPGAPRGLLLRGSRPTGEPAPARWSNARTTPGGGTRRRTGTVWGPRPA